MESPYTYGANDAADAIATSSAITLLDALRRHAVEQPHAVAYIFSTAPHEERELTFSQLLLRVQSTAARLQQRCTPGERAALMYLPGLDFIVAILACFAAGVVAVPLQPPQNRRALPRLNNVLTDSGCTAVLTNRATLQTLRRILTTSLVSIPQSEWLCTDEISDGDAGAFQPACPEPSSLAFLQYTSGSTGTPKGVMVSHANLLANLASMQSAFRQDRNDVAVSWLPMYHDMGLIGHVFLPLYGGIRSVLFSPMTFLLSPARWLHTISEQRATLSGAPSFAYELCVKRIAPQEITNIDLSSWRIAVNGAEPVKAHVLDAFIAKFALCGFDARAFFPCYGMAEATLFVTGGSPHEPAAQLRIDAERLACNRALPSDDATSVLVSCGRTHAEQLRVVDPDSLHLLPDSHVGELWISGPSIAQGYWNKPELTANVFHAYTSNGDGPYLRTGDLGFRHLGEIYVAGRRKDLIIIRGKNYYPSDIESTLSGCHPALQINGVAVFVAQDDCDGRLVAVAEVHRHALARLDASLMHQILVAAREEVLAVHGLRIADMALIKPSTLPKTSSGKIRRNLCRELYLAGTLQRVEPTLQPAQEIAHS